MLIIGSSHLISQTGWNRCNLSLSLSLSPLSLHTEKVECYPPPPSSSSSSSSGSNPGRHGRTVQHTPPPSLVLAWAAPPGRRHARRPRARRSPAAGGPSRPRAARHRPRPAAAQPGAGCTPAARCGVRRDAGGEPGACMIGGRARGGARVRGRAEEVRGGAEQMLAHHARAVLGDHACAWCRASSLIAWFVVLGCTGRQPEGMRCGSRAAAHHINPRGSKTPLCLS